MTEFLSDLSRHTFLQYAVWASLLVSVACGVVGTYVVVRRITYIAGGIAHCVLGGIGVARYLQTVHGWQSLDPMYGALISAVGAAMIIGWVSLHAKQREDTVIGALWAVGMAMGILFISKTPGYSEDLMSYLFGNILMVSKRDLWLMGILDLVIVTLVWLFYSPFLAVCFDEEFARVRGIPVQFYYLLLLCLTALTVVLLTTVVGIVMVIALLTLPVAITEGFSKRLSHIMVFATLTSMILTLSGLAISYRPDWPSGATTILLAGAVYFIVLSVKALSHRRQHD